MWKFAFLCSLTASVLSGGIIGLSIPQPNRYGQIDEMFLFEGTITNDTQAPLASGDLWVNFSGVDFRIDVVDLIPTHNFVLDAGQSTPVISLFTANFNFLIYTVPIDSDAPYPFDVQVQSINDDLSVPLTVSITDGDPPVVEAVVPEPGSLLLLASGAALWFLPRRAKGLLPAVAILLACAAQQGAAQSQTVLFQTGAPGIFWYGQELLIAIPVMNGGSGSAPDVAVSDATLNGVRAIRPNGYTGIGTIASGKQAVAQLAFPSFPFSEGQRVRLVINGVYGTSVEYKFQVSRVLDLPFVHANTTKSGSVQSFSSDVPYNPVRPVYPPGGQTNPTVRFTPLPVNPAAPPPRLMNTAVEDPTPAPEPVPAAIPPIVIAGLKRSQERAAGEEYKVITNSAVDGASNFGHPQDPSGGVAIHTRADGTRRRIVMMTGNTWAAYADVAENALPLRASDFRSIDIDRALNSKGETLDGGFCCDQVIRYLPTRGMWVWIMQTRSANSSDGKRLSNRLRIAWSSTARLVASAGRGWTYIDVTPSAFDQKGVNQWFDYPSMGSTSGYLHVGINLLNSGLVPDPQDSKKMVEQSTNQGRVFFRMPLRDIEDTPKTVSVSFTSPQPANFSVQTDNNEDRIYWASLQANDMLRIWEWIDDLSEPFSRDVVVSTIDDRDYSSNDPAGNDWLQRHLGRAVLGATRETFIHLDNKVERTVTFAWGAGRDSAHPQPFVRTVTFVVDRFFPFLIFPHYTKTFEHDYWSNNGAYHFPALSTAGFASRGTMMAFGGTGRYANPVFGWAGSRLLYLGSSNATDRITTAAATATTPAVTTTRFGDYFTIVPDPAGPRCLSVFGFNVTTNAAANPGGCTLTGAGAGCNLVPRYAAFCVPDASTPK